MQSTENENTAVEVLEEINCSKSVSNIWNNLYDDINPSKRFLYIPHGSFIRGRLIGNVLPCKRTFIGQHSINPVSYFGVKDFKLLCKGDAEAFERIATKVEKDIGKPTGIEEVLIRLFDKDKWQNCFLTNIFVQESNNGEITKSVYAYPFPQSVYKQLVLHIFGRKHNVDLVAGCSISGLFAHDITIRNMGKVNDQPVTSTAYMPRHYNNKDRYSISISDSPTHLTKEEISSILRLGLNDLKEMCVRNNRAFLKRSILRSTPGGLIYDVVEDCKQTDQVCSELITHVELQEAQQQDQEQLQCVEDQLNELPQESFEKQPHEETIASLQL